MRRPLFIVLGFLAAPVPAPAQECAPDNGGLKLPDGFCATVFADNVRGARHIVVAPNGDVFVAIRNSRNQRGGLLALRDTTGDGVADMQVRAGDNGGTGIALRGRSLYFGTDNAVLRYTLPAGNLLPHTQVDTIVRDLPTMGHSAKAIALGRGNDLFVNIGSRTNSCQLQDRENRSPGNDPCTELETRAGIWKFDANEKNQTQSDGDHYATGLRNMVAITIGPDDALYGAQHGRDQLHQNWGFSVHESAENPAEIFVRISEDDDYGWPYCYYDRQQRKHVLAPEYGGDGREVGRCASIEQPLAAYPGHWAPNAVVFYTGSQFPARYRGGVFIAFHGSWNRSPLPQAGFNVVFQPKPPSREDATATPEVIEVFAEPTSRRPDGGANNRPTGLAVAPDGALFITDDAGGRIWRVVYKGN